MTVVDDLRLDTLLRMLKTPHFSTKMNSLKEVCAQTELIPPVQIKKGVFVLSVSSGIPLSPVSLTGDEVDRGEYGVQDGEKCH